MENKLLTKEYQQFLKELKEKVVSSRLKAARSVNKDLIFLYHHIGSEILKRQKIEGWGSKIIHQLSRDLGLEFPEMKGFSIANLHNMRRFAELYVKRQVKTPPLRQPNDTTLSKMLSTNQQP